MRKKFILWDGRAKGGDTDDANAMDTADTEREARRAGSTTWAGHDAIWAEYDFDGREASNERMRTDLPPVSVTKGTI